MLMGWHTLSLRTRILLGYALILVLASGLTVFLIARANVLNTQIIELNDEVERETALGVQLDRQVAGTQQAIDRYLLQTTPQNLDAANNSLRQVTDTLTTAQNGTTTPAQQERLTRLESQLGTYQGRFQELTALLATQAQIYGKISQSLVDTTIALDTSTTRFLQSGQPNPVILQELAGAAQRVRLASILTGRMVAEQADQYGRQATTQLTLATVTLDSLQLNSGDNESDTLKANTDRLSRLITQYADNIPRIRQQRSDLLNTHGEELKVQASAISQAALVRLHSMTTDLGQASSQAQQIALGALAIMLVLAALFGLQLAQTITRPLADLASATDQLVTGNYSATVSTRDRGELGQLAAAFNHMIQILGQQRAALLAQRQALADQNERLEQTLVELGEAKRLAEMAREQALSASAAKSTFLANMSHELRTPLNAIINFTKFLSKERYGELSPRQQELQSRVLANADHLLGLINDILDLSKIEAGRMDLFREITNVSPIIQGVLSTAVGLTKDKDIVLEAEVPDALPDVDIDRTRIRQVLLNLLSNAAKFTEHGSITVRAAVAGRMVQIDVQDTGIGIAPEHHELVFEEFRQVEDEFTRGYQGTGLGLPICKRLVEMHGGAIWLESTPGVGSTFSFTIPLVRADMRLGWAEAPNNTSAGQAQETTAPLAISGSPEDDTGLTVGAADAERKIAVIDDDPDTQRIVRELLASLGCHIYPILNSRQALASVQQLHPDLIILDLQMPEPNGWELLNQLRADAELAQIPVIIYSVVDRSGQKLAIAASDYLVKPVDEVLLQASVRRWLDHQATVLVIDDDPDARQVVRSVLEESYHVIEAADGAAGLELIRTAHPDLVVLDLMMPVLDGFAVLERIRKEPLLATIPVIIVTAKDLEAHERAWLTERAHLFSPKETFAIDIFVGTVHLLLGHPSDSAAPERASPVAEEGAC
jgi:signal transduction histidine kinase/DNA-binding response OmpR family regulator